MSNDPIPPLQPGDLLPRIAALARELEAAMVDMLARAGRGEAVDTDLRDKLIGATRRLQRLYGGTGEVIRGRLLDTSLQVYAALKAAGRTTPELDASYRAMVDGEAEP